jgi:hypothetical protein
VATPEDSKINFEKLDLSQDLDGSLEPVSGDMMDGLLSEAAAEAKEVAEESPAQAEIEPEEKAEPSTTVPSQVVAVPAKSKFKNLLANLSTAEPFTVLLGLAVAALLIAILFCLVELGRYGFDLGAKKAKSTAAISAPAEISRTLS